jgi:hypothetical protein
MRSLIAVVCALLIVGTSSDVFAQKPTKKAVPPAIKAAFEKAYPKAVIQNIDKEKQGGKTYYEVESMDGTTRRDFLYNPDGTVYEIEEVMEVASLPEAVKAGVTKEFPKGKILTAEKVTRGDVTEYELTVKSGKKKQEVRFTPAGAKIKGNAEGEEEDEKGEKGEKE